MVKFGFETPEQMTVARGDITAAREYAAQIHHQMADSVFDDDFGFASHVTDSDKRKYAEDQRKYAEEVLRGEHDNNFTIWQRMNYFLTGECVPFLNY